MKFKFLLLTFIVFGVKQLAIGQCGYGTINELIWGNPSTTDFGFTIDANISDEDTARVVQGEDTTIVIQYLLPKEQVVTAPVIGTVTATVTSVQIQGVTGLPVGMNWTLDSIPSTQNNNTYYPQNYRYGAVTLCGTTFSTPGVKTLTVSTLGCGSAAGQSQCQGVSFNLYIEVLPGQGGNSAFTITPPVGCNTLDVDFNAIFQSSDPVLFPVDFEWDLGDGTTATGASVSGHNYSAPGVYPVKLDVIINEFYISSVTVVASGGWYPDIEELTAVQSPELYGNINGSPLPEQGSGNQQTWTTDVTLSNTSISGQMYDADTNIPIVGSADDDLGSGSTTVTPVDNGSFGISTSNFSMTGIINKRVSDVLTFWDTVKVYSPSTATVTSTNGTSFCGNDSTILDIGAGYSSVQWYNDTTLLLGETNQTLVVNQAGDYYAVVLANNNICDGQSNTVSISVDGVVVPVIMPSANGLEIDNPNGYDVQWYSNGVPIPGATMDELTDLSSGNPFSVTVTNANGCTATSADYNGCLPGSANAPNGTNVDGAVATAFEATGFAYNSQTQIAWSVTPVADGMITSEADVAAINNQNIYLGDSTYLDLQLNCNTLQGPGAYYLTPFLIEAVDLPEFPFPYSDSTCTPVMDLSITFDCADDAFEIGNASVVDPSGTPIDLLSLSPVPISYPIPGSTICGFLGGAINDINLFAIAPNSNPNGTWQIEVENSGTVDMNVTVPAFQVTLLAADCGDITADMIYDYGPYDITVAPGGTEAISITVPPLPTDFPSIAASCSAFGTPVEIDVTNCVSSIEDIIAVENISLYPNPNNGMFTLNFDVFEANEVEISIVDVTGRKVLNRNYNHVYGNFNETFDLKNNLNTGFYFMEIKVGNYATQKKFIVK